MDPNKTVPISTFENPASKIATTSNIGEIISGLGLINIGFFLVGVIFMGSLITAAVSYISATGSPDAISKATTRLVNSLIGLVVVFGSFIIVRLVLATIGAGDINIF